MMRACRYALLGAVLLLSACSKATQANFDQVKEDMSKDEVIALLGEPTQAESGSMLGMSGASLVWEGDDVVISVQILNDKVVMKSLSKRH